MTGGEKGSDTPLKENFSWVFLRLSLRPSCAKSRSYLSSPSRGLACSHHKPARAHILRPRQQRYFLSLHFLPSAGLFPVCVTAFRCPFISDVVNDGRIWQPVISAGDLYHSQTYSTPYQEPGKEGKPRTTSPADPDSILYRPFTSCDPEGMSHCLSERILQYKREKR